METVRFIIATQTWNNATRNGKTRLKLHAHVLQQSFVKYTNKEQFKDASTAIQTWTHTDMGGKWRYSCLEMLATVVKQTLAKRQLLQFVKHAQRKNGQKLLYRYTKLKHTGMEWHESWMD